jgi:hypothetical protein
LFFKITVPIKVPIIIDVPPIKMIACPKFILDLYKIKVETMVAIPKNNAIKKSVD